MALELVKIASTIGLSTFKHTLGGVPMGAMLGFSYWELVLYTAVGGIVGIGIFMFLSQSFSYLISRYFPPKKPKRKFSRMSRTVVKVNQRFGLVGIAFITPWLLSVPVGTIISCGIYRDKRKVFAFQAASIVFWSFAGAAIAQPLASIFY